MGGADFLKMVPFGAAGLKPEQLETTGSRNILAIGLQGSQSAYYWLYDRNHSWEHGDAEEPESAVAGVVLTVTGLPVGNYTATWRDTWKGRVVRSENVLVSGSGMELTAPVFSQDIACRVVQREAR